MQNGRTIQTAFRFRPELLGKMKIRARENDQTLTAYVESLVEKDIRGSEDRYQALFEELSKVKRSEIAPARLVDAIANFDVSKMPRSLAREIKKNRESRKRLGYTEEEIDADPKLQYLLEKNGCL